MTVQHQFLRNVIKWARKLNNNKLIKYLDIMCPRAAFLNFSESSAPKNWTIASLENTQNFIAENQNFKMLFGERSASVSSKCNKMGP